jgi:hypothetical protein
MLSTMTVARVDSVTSNVVKMRNLPISGTTSDVGGIVSDNTRKNTCKLTRHVYQLVISKIKADWKKVNNEMERRYSKCHDLHL